MCINLLLYTTRKYLVLEFKLNNTAQIGPQSHKSFISNLNQKHCTSKPKDILVFTRKVLQSRDKKEGERRGPFLVPHNHKDCLFSAVI